MLPPLFGSSKTQIERHYAAHMGKIVGLSGKLVDPLAIAIRDALEADGSVSQDLQSLTVPLEEWRRLARAVGRELGRPVQTVVSPDAVHAALRDWAANDSERQIHERAMRDAVDAIALSNEVLEPIAACPACGNTREWRPGARFDKPGTVVCSHCGLIEV